MAITVNTNMQAMRIQQNLSNATDRMDTAMERMSSGSRINQAKDDAAGFAVATSLKTIISGSQVASNNVAMGNDVLSTVEGTLDVVERNLARIRDLTEQAANGTYSEGDLSAIASEVQARLDQIDALANSASFNGKKLLDNSQSLGITLQVGTSSSDSLQLSGSIFQSINITGIKTDLAASITAGVSSTIAGYLDSVDSVLNDVVTRITDIGAFENRLEAVLDGLEVQMTNMSSALSTIQDADVAKESSAYVQAQILQSASATLLVQANSAPQIALTLIQG